MARFQRTSWLRSSRGRIAGVSAAVMIASGAGVALAPAVSASTGPAVYSRLGAGYLVSGRWFRYLQTVVQLPSNSVCARLYQAIGGSGRRIFSVSVGTDRPGQSGVSVSVADTPTSAGCGTYQAAFGPGGPVPRCLQVTW